MTTLKSSFSRSTLAVVVVNGFGMALLFLAQVVLARLMGVAEYGVFTYVLSITGVLTLVGKFGLDSTLIRFVPEYTERLAWRDCRGLLSRSFQVALLLAALMVCVMLAITPFFQTEATGSAGASFTLATLVLPVWVLGRGSQGALLAFKKPVYAQLADTISLQSFLIVAALTLYHATAASPRASTMLGALLLACIAALLLGLFLLFRKTMPSQLFGIKANYHTRQWLGVAVPLFVMSSMYVIMNYTDIIMLGMLSNTADSGVYSAASRIAALVSLPLIFINAVLGPYISGFYHNGKHRELQQIISMSAKYAGLLAIPVFAFLWLAGDLLLGLFGEAFHLGRPAMLVLLCSQIINVLVGSVGFIMSMTGNHLFASLVASVSALLNVVLNYLLIPQLGITGAASATAITTVAWNLVFLVFIRNKLGIKPTFFAFLSSRP